MSNFNINEDAQSGGEFSGSQSSFNGESSQPINESAFPDEDEDTITMLDVIEEEKQLEDEASAVLGNSDEKNCTYPKGYVNRQALYSCATCSDGSDMLAAICLACSLECHDNHEVYELYTKRNYRCDCGNSKFKQDFECKLIDKKKSALNDNNKYNHNFSGKYCICDKRYPPDENDDSAESNDRMWQCIVCEDWYHTKHLGAKELPSSFDELICTQCVERLDFVHYYKGKDKIETSNEDNIEQVKTQTDHKVGENSACVSSSQDVASNSSNQINELTDTKISENALCETDTNDSQAENIDPGNSAATTSSQTIKNECTLENLKEEYLKRQSIDCQELEPKKGPLFWSDCTWRDRLCRCQKCLEMYKAKECEYLLDDKDTVQYYEAMGRARAKNTETPMERGMSALNRMDRASVVEALHGYNELKADLSVYLRKFADTKKVVREEDIHEFFSQLKSKKRPRLEFSDNREF